MAAIAHNTREKCEKCARVFAALFPTADLKRSLAHNVNLASSKRLGVGTQAVARSKRGTFLVFGSRNEPKAESSGAWQWHQQT